MWENEIEQLIMDRYIHKIGLLSIRKEFTFYVNRLKSIVHYGLFQGREIVKMVCRCAFNDSLLTDDESIVIMETCLDPALDNILLEVNYNASW